MPHFISPASQQGPVQILVESRTSEGGGPGAELLRFVAEARDEDLPKPVLEHARLAVLDWWGVTVAGAEEPVARILRETVGDAGGPASVLGTRGAAPPRTGEHTTEIQSPL